MGTDITILGEKKVNGIWQLLTPLVENEEYDPTTPESGPPLKPAELYTNRNRNLFAILCGLNNPGFSVEGFEPVAPLRGLPLDVTSQVAQWARHWEDITQAHSHSWLSLKELVEFDWRGKSVHLRAMVDPAIAHLFQRDKDKGFPVSTWPATIPLEYGMSKRDGVEVEWLATYEEIARDFLTEVVAPLRAEFGASDAIRLVFWFDS